MPNLRNPETSAAALRTLCSWGLQAERRLRLELLQTVPVILTLELSEAVLCRLAHDALEQICHFAMFRPHEFTTLPEFRDLIGAVLELLRSENLGVVAKGLACVVVRSLCFDPKCKVQDLLLREEIVEMLVPLIHCLGDENFVAAEAAGTSFGFGRGEKRKKKKKKKKKKRERECVCDSCLCLPFRPSV